MEKTISVSEATHRRAKDLAYVHDTTIKQVIISALDALKVKTTKPKGNKS